MSTTDEVTFEKPAKPTKKKARKPARAAAPKAAKSEVAYPGLTRTACTDACSAKGCVISGGVYCAHPVKGGLQAADQTNPAALKRLQKAREQIAVRLDPDRFKDV